MPDSPYRIPPSPATILRKRDLIALLTQLDSDRDSTRRVLDMETQFRRRVADHVEALPTERSGFAAFKTNPFVLLIHSLYHGYTHIHQIERDILPAKLFSSMETSAGKMVEAVVLPVFGWEIVESEMHTPNSALDGKRLIGGTLRVVTLKSGPQCLNDEMSENFADAIVSYAPSWAAEAGVRRVDFTYGVLYGTKKQSNKKDWHILRKTCEKLPRTAIVESADRKWKCKFIKDGVTVNASVKVGLEWWEYLGGPTCFIELCTGLIRACIKPADRAAAPGRYTIADLAEIVSTDSIPGDFNVSILQQSQLEWLFFIARNFCDEIVS